MKFHTEILNRAQQTVLLNLGAFASDHNFDLVGGTAIALYFGHRRSEDFDFFRQSDFDAVELLAELQQVMNYISSQVIKGTLKGHLLNVKVEFLRHGFPVLKTGSILPKYCVHIASLHDLSAMKLMAISHRPTKKDLVDIHVLCTKFKPLKELLALYQAKYTSDDLGHVLRSLTYFGPADNNANPKMLVKFDWNKIKSDIVRWVAAL